MLKEPDLQEYRQVVAGELDSLRQNQLLDDRALTLFALECGLSGEAGGPGWVDARQAREWLTSDGTGDDGEPRFHPFRIYPLHKLLTGGDIAAAAEERDDSLGLMEGTWWMPPRTTRGLEAAVAANRTTDLAILLEPLYWPHITGWRSRCGFTDDQFDRLLQRYRQKVLGLVRSLDPQEWRRSHEQLRHDAAELDRNAELYLLLRVASWESRKALRGTIAGALWLRHMAEVVRRAFEESHGVRWPEEDRTEDSAVPGDRITSFGSLRPLDSVLRSKSYLALRFGLFTGCVVRWYLDSETEYFAILEAIPEPPLVGIELVYLRRPGEGSSGDGARLHDWLEEDRGLKRFSMVSFDVVGAAHGEAIREEAERGNVVGHLAVHRPDFELANFTLGELVEIAARLDDEQGFDGGRVRGADWARVRTAGDFEARYVEVSERGRPLSAERWGRELAAHAASHPRRPDTNGRRPIWIEIETALRGRLVNYDGLPRTARLERETFEAMAGE